MITNDYFVQITPEGPLPACYLVAEHLWGPGCNIDSDGDSKTPDDRHWTELTLTLRTEPGLRVDRRSCFDQPAGIGRPFRE